MVEELRQRFESWKFNVVQSEFYRGLEENSFFGENARS